MSFTKVIKKGLQYPANTTMLSMRFPQKLWKMINECKSGAIRWGRDGRSIVLDYSKFQVEYLDRQLEFFKTSNITSFVRQLNLYGFRKISNHNIGANRGHNLNIHEFKNENFIQGRLDLLPNVSRKTGGTKSRQNVKAMPTPLNKIPRSKHRGQPFSFNQNKATKYLEASPKKENKPPVTKSVAVESAVIKQETQGVYNPSHPNEIPSYPRKSNSVCPQPLDVFLSQAAEPNNGKTIKTIHNSHYANMYLNPDSQETLYSGADDSCESIFEENLIFEDNVNLDNVFGQLDHEIGDKLMHFILGDVTNTNIGRNPDENFGSNFALKADVKVKMEPPDEVAMAVAGTSHGIILPMAESNMQVRTGSFHGWIPSKEYILPDGEYYGFDFEELQNPY